MRRFYLLNSLYQLSDSGPRRRCGTVSRHAPLDLPHGRARSPTSSIIPRASASVSPPSPFGGGRRRVRKPYPPQGDEAEGHVVPTGRTPPPPPGPTNADRKGWSATPSGTGLRPSWLREADITRSSPSSPSPLGLRTGGGGRVASGIPGGREAPIPPPHKRGGVGEAGQRHKEEVVGAAASTQGPTKMTAGRTGPPKARRSAPEASPSSSSLLNGNRQPSSMSSHHSSELGCPHFSQCSGCQLQDGLSSPAQFREAKEFFRERGYDGLTLVSPSTFQRVVSVMSCVDTMTRCV